MTGQAAAKPRPQWHIRRPEPRHPTLKENLERFKRKDFEEAKLPSSD